MVTQNTLPSMPRLTLFLESMKQLLTIFIMTVSAKKSDASCTNSLSHDNAAS